MKTKANTGRKYLKIPYLIKTLYPENINNSENTIIRNKK